MRTLPTAICIAALLPALHAQETSVKPPRDKPPAAERKRQGGFLGISFVETSFEGAAALEVTSVLDGTDAQKLGFRRGDLIRSVNGRSIVNGDHFIRLLWSEAAPRRSASRGRTQPAKRWMSIVRDGEEQRIDGGLAELDATPAPGERAPDFTLAGADGKTEVTLSKLWERNPVVLVFGSYT